MVKAKLGHQEYNTLQETYKVLGKEKKKEKIFKTLMRVKLISDTHL